MQILTYTKYLKDILGNKRPVPITAVIHLTEECNATILNTLPKKKKKDPRRSATPWELLRISW